MPPELEEVQRWLSKAMNDWTTVEKLSTPSCKETDVGAFHCQQAIEKTLKAFLVYKEIQFEKIHDLGHLLDLCSSIDPEFEQLRDEAEPITAYAVMFRYPGPKDPTFEEVDRALSVVGSVWRFVISRLPEEVRP